MVSDRTGAGSTTRLDGGGNGAGASPAAAPLTDDRYDFLDEHEPDFKWQPVDGSARSGEPSLAPRGRGGLGKPLLIGAGLVVVIALGAGAAMLLKGGKPAPQTARPPAAATPAPAAVPAPNAPASDPVKDVTPPAAETSGGAILEKPLTPPPPGGEDGPPAPEGMR